MVDATVFTCSDTFARFLSTRETIDVSFANNDLFLSIIDLTDLAESSLVLLSHLANHNLKLHDIVLGLCMHIVQLLHLLFQFFLARESSKLAINALNVELLT